MTDITLPGMGESIAEGTVSVWLVDVGGYVEADQPLVTVSTDKADVDVPSPVSGVLSEVLVAAGETVAIGTLIARIDETAAKAAPAGESKKPGKKAKEPAAKKAPSEPLAAPEGVPGAEAEPKAEPEKPMEAPPEIKREEVPEEEPEETDRSGFYSPAVMRAAIEHGVDLKSVRGTGEGGRVTKADVMRAAGAGPEVGAKPKAPPGPPGKAPKGPPEKAAREAPPEAPPGRAKDSAAQTSYGHVYVAPETPTEAAPEAVAKAAAPPAAPAEAAAEGFGTYRVPAYEVGEGDELKPFTRLRRLIADHMVYSKRTAAHVTTFAEADLEVVYHLREKHKGRLKEEGVSLTYLHFVMLATLRALAEYPLMNSVLQGDMILTKKSINLGVAVDTERGLMVPVIKDAGSLGLVELAKRVNEISERVRERKVSPDEMTGGTFTVSNPGRKGNLFGTPIISQPQVGILRMGELVKKPVVVEVDGDDAIVVHPTMYLSLSYDHRVVDGLTSNEFLHRVREHLEEGDFEI